MSGVLSDGAFVQKEASGFPSPSTIQILILVPGLEFQLLWFKKKKKSIMKESFQVYFSGGLSPVKKYKFPFSITIKSSSVLPEKFPRITTLQGFHDLWGCI